jgi:protein O-mannosyl-transferase
MKDMRFHRAGWVILTIGCCLTVLIYCFGLSGGWLFDDYPNIVENPGVQPQHFDLPSLIRAALSSPASDFKRPLASLSFALNYLATGLDPYWMKLTNLLIHVINGCLVFLVARELLLVPVRKSRSAQQIFTSNTLSRNGGVIAALIAVAWMLLPINLTNVLYVVQRMESMANVFVLIGLYGYLRCRSMMLSPATSNDTNRLLFALCVISLALLVLIGSLAKETAVMLPLYAVLAEWVLFRFERSNGQRDVFIIGLFVAVLVLPAIIGIAWLLPSVLNPDAWATRDFTLSTRLLTEARVVVDYINWTLWPRPSSLSFYHDDYVASSGLLHPYTTILSILFLLALFILSIFQRHRRPLLALGILWFLGCQLLTATFIPLELVYEHRNYFASFGLLLAVIPLIATIPQTAAVAADAGWRAELAGPRIQSIWRFGAILIFIGICATQTLFTARAWGDPLRLAVELAARAPNSPRAQYELGRTLIIYSNYNPASPYTPLVYAPLERAATLPGSSILPQQALIFMNSRMGLPLKDAWWDSMIAKLRARPSGVQDDSSLAALVQCALEGSCNLPHDKMVEAFNAALAHPHPSPRLYATYGDYAWNALGDHALGEQMILDAITVAPREPAYRITFIRMLAAEGRTMDAKHALEQLQSLNIGGSLDSTLAGLRKLPALQ